MRFLAIDPGAKNIGWALFDTTDVFAKLRVIQFGIETARHSFYFKLDSMVHEISDVVVEDYIIRNNKKDSGFDHSWDKGETLRCIGAIEFWANKHGKKFHLVQPMDKPAAYGLIGWKYEKGARNVHHKDAIVHGCMFMLRQNLVPRKELLLQGFPKS